MGNRPAFDPYGGCTPQVDKMIGDAFPKVEKVADHIDEVSYVAHNMEAVVAVAAGLQVEKTAVATGIAFAVGSEASIPYPAGVTNLNLRGHTVLLVAGDGEVHLPGIFYSAVVRGGALKVLLLPGAPPAMAGGTIRWRMVYAA